MACLGRSAPTAFNVYQWLEEDGGSLAQSAWGTWVSPLPVLEAFFAGAVLYLLVKHDGTARYLSCDLTPNRTDDGLGHLVHLDARFEEGQVSVSYDENTSRTTFALPIPVIGGATYRIVSRDGATAEGETFPIVSAVGSLIVCEGDARVPCYIGTLYDHRYDFSEFVLRDRDGMKRPIERVNVGMLDLELANTGDLSVQISAIGRPVRSIEFRSRILGDALNVLNKTVLRSGTMRVPVRSRTDRVKISIISRSHLPTRMTGATWRGSYSDRQTLA